MIRNMGGMGLDVDRILNSIDAREMDEWIAFDQIEPELIETLIGVCKLGFSSVVRAWGGEVTPDTFDPRKQKKDEENNMTDSSADLSPDQQVAVLNANSR